MPSQFRNRVEAGRLLAKKLADYANHPAVLVLALPRGGVPVGFEIAQALRAPLEAFVVRKLGVPGQEELAMGAITTGGVRVLNRLVVQTLGISESAIEWVAAKEQQELERRERLYRGCRPAPDILDRTVILVDDGIATGTTMQAAIRALRKQHPARLIVAVPVAPLSTVLEWRADAQEAVCLQTPEAFEAISHWYEDFNQVSDEEVCDLLGRAAPERSAAGA
ncbi:MAG: phosphoribosyl transferase [Acidobacteria bacterium RIFCSPLOWO2_12_FULL_59_11]|nr:MAG: phosphoribosyl transferase [Acidobacteria bacterium RIFCSPLOWO2_12_FULL_59_11]